VQLQRTFLTCTLCESEWIVSRFGLFLREKGLSYPTFGQCATLIFIPLLLLEYAGEAWEPSKKAKLFQKPGALIKEPSKAETTSPSLLYNSACACAYPVLRFLKIIKCRQYDYIFQEGRQQEAGVARSLQSTSHAILWSQDGPHGTATPRGARLLRSNSCVPRLQGEFSPTPPPNLTNHRRKDIKFNRRKHRVYIGLFW